MKSIDEVAAADVARVSEALFKNDMLRLAAIGPFEDKAAFEKVLRV